jgi:hypothetical protein
MARKLMVVSMALGLALASAGCAERRTHRWTGGDRGDRVDINSASQRQLSRLPGISDEDAGRIVANRPYPNTEALVRRGIIGPRKYDAIESYVYAGGGRREWRDDDRDRYRDDDRDRYRDDDRDRYRYDDDRYDHR